jgi:tetratricopeptide (TPR) repeat protein
MGLFNFLKNKNAEPTDAFALTALGFKCYEAKEYKNAIKYLSMAIEIQPENQNLFYALGNAYEDSGNIIQAEINYKKAVTLLPKYSSAIFRLGMLEAKRNNISNAIHLLNNASEFAINENFQKYGVARDSWMIVSKQVILSNLGNLLIQNGQIDRGIEYLDQAIKIDSEYAKPYAFKGIALVKSGQEELAIQYLNKAYQLGEKSVKDIIKNLQLKLKESNPRETDLKKLHQKVIDHAKAGNFDKALQVVDQMKSLPVNKSGIFFLSATIKASANDWKGCAIDSKECIKLDPNNSDAWNHLGVALCNIGDVKNGIDALKTAVNKGNIGASNNLKYWSTR